MSPAPVRCRLITADDHIEVAKTLARNFPHHKPGFWTDAVARLARHTQTQNHPHTGYLLQSGDSVVGVLLMIFSRPKGAGSDQPSLRCNVSSWCVDEAYRGYASLLVRLATRDPNVSYTNISPALETRLAVEAQGFHRYADSQFFAIPLLSPPWGERVICVEGSEDPPAPATPDDIALMRGHAGFECLKFWCGTKERVYPFLLVVRPRARGLLRAAHVAYCDSPDVVGRFARTLGLALAKRGVFVLTIDAHTAAEAPGLRGLLRPNLTPKYIKGSDVPRLGDLSFTEMPMFGV